jgi:hypothetical protein
VNVPGALLYLGDGHAAMGDGEIAGRAIEVPLHARLQVTLIKGRQTGWPRVENDAAIMAVGIYRPTLLVDTAGCPLQRAHGGQNMRTIGLIGGMSWESTAEYYRIINQSVRRRLGALRSAPLILFSVDFGPIERLYTSAALAIPPQGALRS